MRIATFLRICLAHGRVSSAIGLLFLLMWIDMLIAAPATVYAAPDVQSLQSDGSHLYLIPNQTTGVTLDMHSVELRLATRDDGLLSLVVDAEYRLQNDSSAPVLMDLALSAENPDVLPVQADGATLAANGQPLALEPNQAGALNAQVTVQPDSGSTLVLQYQLVLRAADITEIRYAPRVLDSWPGRPSLRVDMVVPYAIDSASWVHVQPEGWSYGSTADTGAVDLKWLYDGIFPSEAFGLEFISPSLWTQIQTLSQTTSLAPTPSAFAQLGAIYRRLMARAVDDDVRNRFYSQAVAAYSAGLALPQTGNDQGIVTEFHTGLAALYRNRAAKSSGNLGTKYAELMVAEANEALALLGPDDARARELQQWWADGLHIQLQAAKTRYDWVAALQIVDELAKFTTDTIDATALEQERRALRIQQALQLMERGDRSGAEALAGPDIDDVELAPPSDLLSIFAGWQISVSAGLRGFSVRALVTADNSRAARAQAALDQVIQTWQTARPEGADTAGGFQVTLQEVGDAVDTQQSWRLDLRNLDEVSAGQLATLLPVDANWALLRTLLAQLAPNINVQGKLMRDQVRMSQPLDLRVAGDQWAAMGSSLERRAHEFEAQQADASRTDPAEAEQLLQVQIQAANYRNSATEWQNLSRQSWVLFTFELDEPEPFRLGGASLSRSWYATVSTPSQVLVFQTQSLALGRLVGMSAGSFLLVVLLAGCLWWLL